jgi:hypothetical protein
MLEIGEGGTLFSSKLTPVQIQDIKDALCAKVP